jgi:hypothetical protein
MKSTTEQKVKSQEKNILEKISYKEFSAICEEYQIVEKATKELLELTENPDITIREKFDIFKWILEMNIGKPRQMQDINITDEDETIEYQVTIVGEKETEEELKKLKAEIIELGGTEEMIEERIDSIRKPLSS